jgi:hypothetical protein
VVALAERWRDLVLAAVVAGDEPFATVGHAWLRGADPGEQAPGGAEGTGGH